MDYKFYDTSSLLLRAEDLFTKEDDKDFGISTVTLEELENIKVSANKSPEVKCAARHLLNLLDSHRDLYTTIIYKESMAQEIKEMNLELTNDTKIISCALYFDKIYHPDETIFVTNDIAQKALASLFFGEDCLCISSRDTSSTQSSGASFSTKGAILLMVHNCQKERLSSLAIPSPVATVMKA